MNIFTQFFKANDPQHRRAQIEQDLIRRETVVAKDIFGPVPAGRRREFFCLDESTWIWYEEWIDDAGVRRQVSTRYIIRPQEVLKSQNGGEYYRLTTTEFKNFKAAAERYYETVKRNLYSDFKEPTHSSLTTANS